MLEQFTSEQLEAEIEKRKKFREPRPEVKQPVNLTKLRELCGLYLDAVEAKETEDSDLPNYIFEEAMSTFYGARVWDFIRSWNK